MFVDYAGQTFDVIDRPALKDLPAEPYQYAEWRARRVGLDYHSLPRRRPGSTSTGITIRCRTG